MDRVGEVVRIAQGLLVVQSDSQTYPDIGTEVVNERLEPVGSVVDIIGPKAKPYVVISPKESSAVSRLLNQRLYRR